MTFNELVVLCNDMNGSRVRSNRAQSRNESKNQSIHSPEVVDQIVSKENDNIVKYLIESDAGVIHEDRSQGIENLDDSVEDVFVPLIVS